MKKLGFGLMRLPLQDSNNAASIDIDASKAMVDLFLERGFTYFDTAWMYHSFQSEAAVKEILTSRYPRDRYTLATKLHAGFIKSKEDRDKIFDEQRRKTGVDYFDYYLLHDVKTEHYKIYETFDCFSWLSEKKRQGLVRHMGFSFHDNAAVLDKVLTEHPEFDFLQLQINYLDWDSDAIQSRKCYETAVKHGKKVIVMEPVKGGTLAKVPKEVELMLRHYRPDMSVPSWGIRFAAGLDNVFMVLSGMSSREQVLDNTDCMQRFQPLSEEEHALIKNAVTMIKSKIAVPCTGCAYCADGCPKHIAIAQFFSLYNADRQNTEGKAGQAQIENYNSLTKHFGRASDCLACGQCEGVCPQHLPIAAYMKDVAKHFEH